VTDDDFAATRDASIRAMADDLAFKPVTEDWFLRSTRHRYSYNFSWLGRPIIQYPQDIVAMQELIWEVKPDLIVETGIARGGSLVFYASMLELLGGDGRVVGIDIDIRSHNRRAILDHPMAKRIDMIEGSSIAQDVADNVHRLAAGRDRVLVALDSHHTHDHVARELALYSPLVKPGSYVVVFDTVIEQMPSGSFPDRDWDENNNPATAVRAFLQHNDRFVVDSRMDMKLLISVAPGGYLRCIKE
jgi:cephalosporin hydroxylase